LGAPTKEDVKSEDQGNGGDGKMKLEINLKDIDQLDDIGVGAASLGVVHQGIMSKDPSSNVGFIAGFGHEVMKMVSGLENDKKSP